MAVLLRVRKSLSTVSVEMFSWYSRLSRSLKVKPDASLEWRFYLFKQKKLIKNNDNFESVVFSKFLCVLTIFVFSVGHMVRTAAKNGPRRRFRRDRRPCNPFPAQLRRRHQRDRTTEVHHRENGRGNHERPFRETARTYQFST